MRRVTVAFDVPAEASLADPRAFIEPNHQVGDLWHGWKKPWPNGEVEGVVVSNVLVESDKERADRLEREIKVLIHRGKENGVDLSYLTSKCTTQCGCI